MNYDCAVKGENISKKFKTFTLDIPDLRVPKGFATALIGENGAGKTTLLNMLSGIRLDYKGELTFFDKYSSEEKERRADVKNRIGYTGTGRYYLPQWTVSDVEEISSLLFDNFDRDEFERYCRELAIFPDSPDGVALKKKCSALSDGTRTKLMLAGVMARDTDLLLLDEPFSALDYQTRLTVSDEIYGIIRKEGKTAILVTHDIAEAISMSDRILVFSSRPAKLRAVHRIELTVGNTPLSRRNSPEFKDYFDMIWKEIDHDEQ